MGLYESIRQDNVRKYGTEAKRTMKIIINQYSDRTHFIYEILQNAEDAEATQIKFHLYKDRLVIFHDGRPFNEKDIIGVCGIADGTKEDGSRIGHFGIGFKSVYGYTETPIIYSGKYHFSIQDQLFPNEVPPMPGLSPAETCMVLPFNKEDVTSEVAYKEICEALFKKITAESIIILDNIADINIKAEGNSEEIHINKEKGKIDKGGYVYALSLLTTVKNSGSNINREIENDYLYFTDGEKEASAIIFKVDGKELQMVKNSKIYAFFPTAKEAHQNFYIHAPFDTTPARDNFKEGAEYGKHNIELINNICRLIYFAFCWLRDNGYLTFSGLNRVFPIYEYEESDILYAIYENSVRIIKDGEKLLPTNKEGVYKSIHEICVPSNMGIVNVFDDEDLQRIMFNKKLFWISKEISTVAYASFKAFLDNNFSFNTLEWKDLVLKMDASYLEEKNIQWMERLMGNIESFCIRRSEPSSHFIDATRVPFIRLNTGKHILARDNGKLQVYLNNPTVCKYKIDDSFRKNETIRSFYERALQVPVYDLERETIDKILPKYVTRKVSFKTSNPIKENIEDLKEIKDALFVNPNIIEHVKDKYIVTNGKEWYRPEELYIRSEDVRAGYGLVKGIINIRFLANSYFDDTVLNIKLDEAFFKQLGCSLGLKTKPASKEEYLKAVHRYCGKASAEELRIKIFKKNYISKKLDWSFNYEGFPDVFSQITPQKSLAIARFLNKNINIGNFDVQGDLVGADDQHFGGANVHSVSAYTMLGLQLCFEKWVFVQGDSTPKSVMEVDRADLLPAYNAAQHVIDMLPFKEVKNGLTEFLEANISDKSKLDLVKRYFSNPDEIVRFAEAFAKSEAKKAARDEKRGDILEKIKNSDKSQQQKNGEEHEFEISPISEKAKARRETNLDGQLAESLDQQTKVARGLYFSSRTSSKEEREFLSSEYSGYCQICTNRIEKYDGGYYFEAINIIKQGQLLEKYNHSVGLGWNSLCLCPNCAAAYNYSSKKISTIYSQVMETEVEAGSTAPIILQIEMPQGTAREIKYSPRHFLALKEAFKVFTAE